MTPEEEMTDKLAEVREKIAESLRNNILKQGWKLSGFEGDIWDKSYVFADQILNTPITGRRCPMCKGEKFDPRLLNVKTPCSVCKGTGRLDKTKTFWEWAKLGMESIK